MRRKSTNSSGILITMDILKELRDADISSIPNFTDLARLLGGKFRDFFLAWHVDFDALIPSD